MAERCCRNCVYGRRGEDRWLRVALSRWPGMLICSACADTPGRTCGVYAGGVCRNFRPRPGVQIEADGPSPEGTARRIPLTQGKFALVDADDFGGLSKHKWCAMRAKHTWYACRREAGRTILMHRVIMKTPKGMVVDHKDRNGLDNRKANLRNCTWAQNNRNSGPRSPGTGFRGVRYDEERGKYVAAVRHKGGTLTLGEFDDPAEAALARDRKAYELQGQYAYLNFPDRIRRWGRIVHLAGAIVARTSARARLVVTRMRVD